MSGTWTESAFRKRVIDGSFEAVYDSLATASDFQALFDHYHEGNQMLSKLKYVLLAVPVFLLIAASTAPGCFAIYQARCCALGDGVQPTPGGRPNNSGFTPGRHTRCVDNSLGSPWYCTTANPAENINLKNDFVYRHQDCSKGGTGCQIDWKTSGSDGKCTQFRYTCSLTVHGGCNPLSQADYDCKGHELIGAECTTYAPLPN